LSGIEEGMSEESGAISDENLDLAASMGDTVSETTDKIAELETAIEGAKEKAKDFGAEAERAFKDALPNDTDWKAVKEMADYLEDIGAATSRL